MKTMSIMTLQIWASYFMSIVAWQQHPGNSGIRRMTMDECTALADEMLAATIKRFPKEEPWDGWRPE